MGKKVLFSEGHGEVVRSQKTMASTFLSAIGGSLNPFVSLEKILVQFDYSLQYTGQRKLTLNYLRKYDILFVIKPTAAFTPSEIAAIEKFVQLGGSLLLIGSHALPTFSLMPKQILGALKRGIGKSHEYLNNISRKFGIFFISDRIQPGKNKYTAQNIYPIPLITHFEPHPIFQKIKSFYFEGGPIELTAEATPIAYTDPDTHPSKAIVMAASKRGDGCVFATGSPLIFIDNRIQDLSIRNSQHAQLVLNIFTWLAHKDTIKKKAVEEKISEPHAHTKTCPLCGGENPVQEHYCRICGSAI